MFGDAGDDLPAVFSRIDLQLQQLVSTFDLFCSEHLGDAQLDFCELIDADACRLRIFLRLSLWSGTAFFLFHLSGNFLQFFNFRCDLSIFDFFEQDLRLAEGHAGLQRQAPDIPPVGSIGTAVLLQEAPQLFGSERQEGTHQDG